MATPTDLVLVSSDGELHRISRKAARVFRALDTLIENLSLQEGGSEESSNSIPLPNVSSRILGKMIAWSEEHVTHLSSPSPPVVDLPSSPPSTNILDGHFPVQPVVKPKVPKRQPQLPPTVIVPTPWERDFLDKNRDELYDILLAANYLDVKRLMDILCARVADLIKGKDPATIRKTFHVPEPPSTNEHDDEQT